MNFHEFKLESRGSHKLGSVKLVPLCSAFTCFCWYHIITMCVRFLTLAAVGFIYSLICAYLHTDISNLTIEL